MNAREKGRPNQIHRSVVLTVTPATRGPWDPWDGRPHHHRHVGSVQRWDGRSEPTGEAALPGGQNAADAGSWRRWARPLDRPPARPEGQHQSTLWPASRLLGQQEDKAGLERGRAREQQARQPRLRRTFWPLHHALPTLTYRGVPTGPAPSLHTLPHPPGATPQYIPAQLARGLQRGYPRPALPTHARPAPAQDGGYDRTLEAGGHCKLHAQCTKHCLATTSPSKPFLYGTETQLPTSPLLILSPPALPLSEPHVPGRARVGAG